MKHRRSEVFVLVLTAPLWMTAYALTLYLPVLLAKHPLRTLLEHMK